MSITRSPIDYQNLFLDMNCFFASVEQQVQPTLRGKPVGVAPYTGDSGCIIAASKEAKAMGVKIGRVGEMKSICPKMQIVESRPALYMIYHKEIRRVIESFTPFFEPLSIDEFNLILTRREQSFEASERLALSLKEAIRDKVGDSLTCSIGVGPSRFLAKMAGERKKPDGLTFVHLSELFQFYDGLKLTDITGINYAMEKRLNHFGLYSPIQFFNSSLYQLRDYFGHVGRLWYYRLRGYEVDQHISLNKSIGHSHVLAPEFRSVKGAEAVIRKLIYKVGSRIRSEKYWATGVSVSVSFYSGNFHQSKKVERFCDDATLTEHIFSMLGNCRWRRPSYVSINVFGLIKEAGEQLSFFPKVEKKRLVSKAIDSVNDHFGPGTIYPASMHGARDSAPDRISFGKPNYEIKH